jgi:hypothetical protein
MSRWRFRSWRFVRNALIAIVVLYGVAQYYTDWLFTGSRATEARAICRAVRDAHVLPPQADAQCGPGLWKSDLFVYGVRDAATQEQVIEIIRAEHDRLAAKPVNVEFRTEFRWRAVSPDRSVADKGELLRAEVVR